MVLGAVELPLNCAGVLDPENVGLDFWYSTPSPTDPRADFYERRLQCYDLVLDSLSVFEKASSARKTTDLQVGDDPEAVRSHAYELAFESNDEMFHSTLYDWLIGRGLADELLEVCSFFLSPCV
jgi:nuclear pore complex protein Nup155